MNKQTNYLRKLLPAALLITAVAPANAFCPVNFFPDPLFRPSFVSSQASIDAALTAFNARTRVSIQKNSDVVTAAIGVLTAQKALAATQIGKAIENNTQVQAQAQQSVETAKKLKEIEEEFGRVRKVMSLAGSSPNGKKLRRLRKTPKKPLLK